MTDKQFTWPKGEELVYLRPPKEEYHGKLPNFHSPDLFPELKPLTENWEAIRDEIFAYEKESGPVLGMTYAPADTNGVNKWNTIYLMSFMVQFHKKRKKFPVICNVVNQIPSATTIAISVLSPHAEIKPHYGDTNGVIRAHLGLIVPDEFPTLGIKVGDEKRGWKNGELLLFTIVNQHSVWSNSDKKRYLLIIDFVPKVLEKKMMKICSKTLGSQTYIFLYHNLPFIKYLPEFMVQFICFGFSIFWRLYLPVQRKFKFASPV